MQKKVLMALEDAGIFTSGGLVKDKVQYYLASEVVLKDFDPISFISFIVLQSNSKELICIDLSTKLIGSIDKIGRKMTRDFERSRGSSLLEQSSITKSFSPSLSLS